MYGEISGVIGAHTTLETGRSERITWLYNNNQVYSAEQGPEGGVVKENIMKLNLSTG